MWIGNAQNLKFLGAKDAEWYDIKKRKIMKGKAYAYSFTYKGIQWLINVRINEDKDQAIVKLVGSSNASLIPLQLTQKTIILQKSKVKGYMYVPASITYFNRSSRRVRYTRISEIEKLPESVKNLFSFVKYEEAALPELIHPQNPHRGKLVALIEEDNLEKMALFYVCTRILPVYEASNLVQ